MGRLIQADRRATLTEITTRDSRGMTEYVKLFYALVKKVLCHCFLTARKTVHCGI